jgi:hypothetical protein
MERDATPVSNTDVQHLKRENITQNEAISSSPI